MALYVLGDPHLSFSVDKPMDIFGARWKDHAEKIKKNWNDTVGKDDTVVLAGDLSWGISLEEAKDDLDFLHTLAGKKILLRGNHDYWWETHAKMQRFFDENGWEDFHILHNTSVFAEGFSICGTRGWNVSEGGEQDQKILRRELQRLEHSLSAAKVDAEKIVFFHFPPMENDVSPFLPILKKYGVRLCYYGHLHGTKALNTAAFEQDGIQFHLISCDAINFTPRCVSDDFQGLIAKNNQNSQKNHGFWRKVLSYFIRKS